jgi:hypothetical protein
MSNFTSFSPIAASAAVQKALEDFGKIQEYGFFVFFTLATLYSIILFGESALEMTKDLQEGLMGFIQPMFVFLLPAILMLFYKIFGIF